jgi:hypothetical protein
MGRLEQAVWQEHFAAQVLIRMLVLLLVLAVQEV